MRSPWYTWRPRQRRCMHHDRITGSSWIESMLINMGAGKMFWCERCDQTWFV